MANLNFISGALNQLFINDLGQSVVSCGRTFFISFVKVCWEFFVFNNLKNLKIKAELRGRVEKLHDSKDGTNFYER